MHELSIALSILDCAVEESSRRGGVEVRAVHIQLGPLAGVIKDALLSAFELARDLSPFPDCALKIEEVPLRAFCRRCQCEREIASVQSLVCGECGELLPDIVGGRELEIVALEIDDTPETSGEGEEHATFNASG